MTTQELKNNIEKVLGNSIRCLLPSYWWKKLFHSVADRIDEVEQKVDGIEIPDGVPIVNSKSELNGLKLPNGSVASVVTEGYGFSQCYLPTIEEIREGFDVLFPKLTRVRGIDVKNIRLEDGEVGIAYLYGSDYPSSNNGMQIVCGREGATQLCYAACSINGEESYFMLPAQVQILNQILAEYDMRVAMAGRTIGSSNEEDLATLDKVFAINGTSDVYTKGASWEKLAKESDITGEGGNTSGDGLIFGKERYAHVSKHKDVNGNITELGLSEEHMAYNQETYEMLESGDKVYLSYEGTFWMQVGYAASHFYFSTASMVLPYDNKVFGRIIELSSDGEISLVDTLVGGSSSDITVDTEISSTSKNAVQNKVIKKYIDDAIANVGGGSDIVVDTEISSTSINPVQNKVVYSELQKKQGTISDLADIRSGAALGKTALQSIPSEYITEKELNNALASAITLTLNTEV